MRSQNTLGVARTDRRPSGVESRKRDPQGSPLPDLHLNDRIRDTPMGHPSTKSKREGDPCKNKRDATLSM